MLAVKSDFYNAVFNNELNAPNVQTVRIDAGALDLIDPSVVTIDNIWNICVLLSMLTASCNCSILCKDDVDSILPCAYKGKCVVDAVKAHLLYPKSDTEVRSTIERAYANTDLYRQFADVEG